MRCAQVYRGIFSQPEIIVWRDKSAEHLYGGKLNYERTAAAQLLAMFWLVAAA